MSSTIKKLAFVALVISFVFAGCTRYANEEELKVLEDTQKAVKKAKTQLADLKSERRSLESKLAEKEKELKAAVEEKAAVESRIK